MNKNYAIVSPCKTSNNVEEISVITTGADYAAGLALLTNTPAQTEPAQTEPMLHSLKQTVKGISLNDKIVSMCFIQDGAHSAG